MADGEKKTIQINPEMFKVSGNTTRKNRAPRQSKNPIKVKAPPPPSKNNSTLKKNLLKMIRNHQQQQSHSQSKQSQSTPVTPPISVAPILESNTPKSEFEQSMQFLEKVNEKSQEKKEKKLRKPKNQTIRSVIPIGSVANRKKTAPSSVATPPSCTYTTAESDRHHASRNTHEQHANAISHRTSHYYQSSQTIWMSQTRELAHLPSVEKSDAKKFTSSNLASTP